MLFDTHAHYYDVRFESDRDELLQSLKSGGVDYILNAGCDVKTSTACVQTAKKYDFAYASVGIHPENAHIATEDDFATIRALCAEEKVRAVGEIGLDYHYGSDKAVQKAAFVRQMDMAHEEGLPFVIHCRDAYGDCVDILRSEYKGGGAAMHCFGGSTETAKILLNMGIFIAVGGTLTFKNNVRATEAVRYTPLDMLLLETDAPYLAPVPHRGERNSSLFMHLVAKKVAELKGISEEEVACATTSNAKRFFGIE